VAPDRKGVFISYRRDSGAVLARLIEEVLISREFSPCLDVNSNSGGHFDERLLRQIEECLHLVLICTGDSLHPHRLQEGDWVRREIAHALKCKRNIIPVTEPGFKWPEKSTLPPDIATLHTIQTLVFNHQYWKNTKHHLVERLEVTEAQVARTYERQQEEKALTLEGEARAAEQSEDWGAALKAQRDLVKLRRRIFEDAPTEQSQEEYALSLADVARLSRKTKSPEKALSQYNEAKELLTDLPHEQPPGARSLRILALLADLEDTYRDDGQLDKAERCLDASVDACRRAIGQGCSPGYLRDFGSPLRRLADRRWDDNRHDEALPAESEYLELLRRWAQSTDRPDAAMDLGARLELTASRVHAAGLHANASTYLDEAIGLRRRLAESSGAVDGDLEQLCSTLDQAAELDRASGRPDKAIACLEEALPFRRMLVERVGGVRTLRDLRTTLTSMAELGLRASGWNPSSGPFLESLEAWHGALKARTDSMTTPGARRDLAEVRDLRTEANAVRAQCDEVGRFITRSADSLLSHDTADRVRAVAEGLAFVSQALEKMLENIASAREQELRILQPKEAARRGAPIATREFLLGLECIQKLRHARDRLPQATADDETRRLLEDGRAVVFALQRAIEPGTSIGSGFSSQADGASLDQLRLALESVRAGSARHSLYEFTIVLDGFAAQIDLLRVLPDRLELVAIQERAKPMHGMLLEEGTISAVWRPCLQGFGFSHELLRRWLATHHDWLGIPATTPILGRMIFVDPSGVASRGDILGRDNFKADFHRGSRGSLATVTYVGRPEPKRSDLLCEIPVDAELEAILREAGSSADMLRNRGIAECMGAMRDMVDQDRWPDPDGSLGVSCRSCEFRGPLADQSGFMRCWGMDDFPANHVAELFRVSTRQFHTALSVSARGRHATIADLDRQDLTPSQIRHWSSVKRDRPEVDPEFAADPIAALVPQTWSGPVQFLNIEASFFPIPSRLGGRPFEYVPFQFEGHQLPSPTAPLLLRTRLDGFLSLTEDDPRRGFIDALRMQFGSEGPIYHWHHFGPSLLRSVLASLRADDAPADRDRVEFIESLVGRGDGTPGRLVDLMLTAKDALYHPALRGSYSIRRFVRIAWAEPSIRAAFMRGHGAMGDPDHYSDVEDPYDGLPSATPGVAAEMFGEEPAGVAAEAGDEAFGIRSGGMANLAYQRLWLRGGTPSPGLIAQFRRHGQLDSAAVLIVYALMRDIAVHWARCE
jgi:tetratricopeptide (TPR) repeat protein